MTARFGPVEVVALAFPGEDVPDAVLDQVAGLARADGVRLLDLAVVLPTADGFDVVEAGALGPVVAELADDLAGQGLAGEHDLRLVAGALPPASGALVLVVEHLWALGLTAAVHEAGAVVLAAELVPGEVVDALVSG